MLAVRRALPGVAVALLLLAAAAYPWLSDSDGMRLWTGIFISAVLASAWNIVAGYCGYPSFGNVAFLGLGAYTTAVLMNHHVPFLVTLLAGAALAGTFALLVGWPILRVRTHYFAIATLGLAEIVRAVVTNTSKISGGGEGITLPIPPGEPFFVDLGFYFGALGLLVLVTATAWWLLRGRVGYGWRAIAASEDGALATGVDATRLKLLAWVLSATFTGAAGSIYAYWLTFIEPGSVFSISLSLKMIVGTLFGGVGSLAGPLLGTVVMELLAHVAWANFLYLHALIFAALVVAIITFFPSGLWPLVARLWEAATRRLAPVDATEAAPAGATEAAPAGATRAARPAVGEGPPILAVEGLCKNFGGLAAVSGVSFSVRRGEIVGLVGPNGSGKTTVLNLISGLMPVSAGSVSLDGRPVQGMGAHRIARAGVGRTFQIVRDFPGMTVRDSVRVGALYGGGREPVAARVDAALHLLGLHDRAGAISGNLSGADRRRVELAKAVAMRPRLLLLDEVMVGLNPSEAEGLIDVIRRLNQSGISVLMVEHVMRAVMSLCDRVVVLNRGEVLAEGTPETVTRDERVIAAYLGVKFRGGRAANAANG